LPQSKDQIDDLARKLNVPFAKVAQTVSSLHESNPMLGHRGCRLGIAYPEISEMQSRALFRAALAVAAKTKKDPKPEIMIPLVGFERELELQLEIIDRVAKEEFAAAKRTLEYKVGTMIEIPRAALTSEQIAKHAQFFSFGTNDLTQTVLGMSRDDAGHFLPFYEKEAGIIKTNPFASLDQIGVGRLMEIAIEGGKKTRPDIKLGICGEHGGDPSSIDFCNKLGLNYVSCSPFRVPVARIAAARSAVKLAMEKEVKKVEKPVAKARPVKLAKVTVKKAAKGIVKAVKKAARLKRK
jgi:pyruvate,orthophosphate dikinase